MSEYHFALFANELFDVPEEDMKAAPKRRFQVLMLKDRLCKVE
jgi:hypothetical protein